MAGPIERALAWKIGHGDDAAALGRSVATGSSERGRAEPSRTNPVWAISVVVAQGPLSGR